MCARYIYDELYCLRWKVSYTHRCHTDKNASCVFIFPSFPIWTSLFTTHGRFEIAIRKALCFWQKAQLSQKYRAMLHVIKYFAKSLKITHDWTIRKIVLYGFLFVLCILQSFPGSEIVVENRDFSYAVAFYAPLGGPRRKIAIPFGAEKN